VRYPQYQGGGPIVGPSHNGGGVKIPVKNGEYPVIEAEGGEFIVSKEAMEKYGPQIRAMNEDGNDEPLLEGYYQSGGPLLNRVNQQAPTFSSQPVITPPIENEQQASWFRNAVEKYIPSDVQNDTEALINLGEAIIPMRLPTMDDFRAIWKSENRAQEMMNFGLMFALAKRTGKLPGKGKKRRKNGRVIEDVGADEIRVDAKRQIKKLKDGRLEGRIPVLKGGRQRADIHGAKQSLFSGMKNKFDDSPWTGDFGLVDAPGTAYDGFRLEALGNGRYRVFDKRGNVVQGPNMPSNKPAGKQKGFDMDSHDYGGLMEMMKKEGVIDSDIIYTINTPKGPQVVNKDIWNVVREEKVILNSQSAMTKQGKPYGEITSKVKILPREKGGLPENGGRLYRVEVDGKPITIQSGRYEKGRRYSGWYLVDDADLVNPGAIRTNNPSSTKYLGANKKEVQMTLRSGENPKQRHIRKQTENIKKKREIEPKPTPIESNLSPMIKEDMGSRRKWLARLSREKQQRKIVKNKAQIKADTVKRGRIQEYTNAKRRKEIPKGMSMKDWIENQEFVEMVIKKLGKNKKGGK